MSQLIFIIEDDWVMADCLAQVLSAQGNYRVQTFSNALSAMAALNEELPNLIVLDVLLGGPDGFTFLNELISYQDTARIPVVIASSLDFKHQELGHYGVVEVLNKETMTPQSLFVAVQRGLEGAHAV